MAPERENPHAGLNGASASSSDDFEQAAIWLARFDAGEVDEAEFEAWRAADPRHAAAFAQVAATWNRLDIVRHLPHSAMPLQAASSDSPAVEGGVASRWQRRDVLRLAAGGVAVAIGGSLVIPRAQARQYASTKIGGRRRVALGDGSHAELNTDTAVSWRIGSSIRHFWLERGEVALTVTADPARPFLFSSEAAMVQLTAGSFNTRLQSGVLNVLVLHGRALVAADAPDGGAPRAASAGDSQNMQVTKTDAESRKASELEISASLAWRHGEIIFDGTTLDTAIAEYNRYLSRKLVIGDPALAHIRLGGRFVSTDPHDFLVALQATFGVSAHDDGSGVIILAR
jgi:transmembrane sensor